MKKTLIALGLLLLGASGIGNAFADGNYRRHYHSHVDVGIAVTPYWGRPWYYPTPYYSAPYYPPVIIERAAPVYIEQAPQTPAPPTTYWYYCRSANAYHPYVKACPEGWMKVLPQSPDNP